VLDVTGSSALSPGVTRLGRLGTELLLHVNVSASDDQTCQVGTHGTVTLFASYDQGHHDRVQFHLTGSCAGYDLTYLGSQLFVLVAEDGHQVSG